MAEQPKILVINPGSTSTKVAVFQGERLLVQNTLRHTPDEFDSSAGVLAQKDARTRYLLDFLRDHDISAGELSAVVGRGGLLKPVVSGTYAVNERMLLDLNRETAATHASSLGGIMAAEIGMRYGIPAYIVDPVVVDEMEPVARPTGIPGIERHSIFHALNAKAVARTCAGTLGIRYEDAGFIVAHMGGGISVGAHRNGRVIDVNDALNGDGPFSPERCGSVPLGQVIEMCYSGKYSQEELLALVTRRGGMLAHLGTNDLIQVEKRIEQGDALAALIMDTMAYQVAKEIGAMAVVLEGHVDAIVLTGGLAKADCFVASIRKKVDWIGTVLCQPGEEEMSALAAGALRVLSGLEEAKEYQ